MDRYEIRKKINKAFGRRSKADFYKYIQMTDESSVGDVLWECMEEADNGRIAKRELEVLREKIKELGNKSGQRVRCIKALDDRRALIQLGPLKEEVMVSPEVDMRQLTPGTEVLVVGTQEGRLIAAIREPAIYDGRLTKVQRILDANRIIIEDGGHELILKLADWVTCKEGDEIRYDLESQMVLEVISSKEKSAYSLSDNPSQTFDDIKGLEEEKKYIYERIIYPVTYNKEFEKYGIKPPRGILFYGPPGNGKAQPLDSDVLTPNGFIKMKDIVVNSEVSTPDGHSAKVIGVFPQGKINIYKVTFSDGTHTECCENHLWVTRTSKERDYQKPGQIRSLKQIRDSIFYGKSKKKNHSIGVTKTIQFPAKSLPIDPYLLGVIIGDGSISNRYIKITNKDSEIWELLKPIIYKIGFKFSYDGNYSYRIIPNSTLCRSCSTIVSTDDHNKTIFYKSINDVPKFFRRGSVYGAAKHTKKYKGLYWEIERPEHQTQNILKIALLELGLLGKKSYEKFIPEVYKFTSINDRLELLKGLLDTDGCVDSKGTISFSSVSKDLIEGVRFLVESLGGICTMRQPICGRYKKGDLYIKTRQYYTISIMLPNGIIPFKLPRKIARLRKRTRYGPIRYISNIEYVGEKEAQCIYIDHPDHLYMTNNCILTHNTMLAGAIFNKMLDLRTKQASTLKAKTDSNGFYVINGPSVLNKWAGNTEQTIRKIFQEARESSISYGFPSIIFWDEIDSIAGKRKDTATYTPEKTIVPTLLSEIQGLNNGDGEVILIGATNMPNLLDPALLRPGRFGDMIIEIPRIGKEAAMDILKMEFGGQIPDSLVELINQGLPERLVAHVYDNTEPLAYARTKSGKQTPIMRQELVSGALFSQIGEELVRKTCIADIDKEAAPTIEQSIEMVDHIFLMQIGVLDAGVKSGFTLDISDYVIDVSVNA